MQEEPKSIILEYFGDHPLIRIVDFLMDNRPYDYSKKQIAEGTGLGVATVFKYFGKLEEAQIAKVSRRFGGTKLYKLNGHSPVVKKLYEIETLLANMQVPGRAARKGLAT